MIISLLKQIRNKRGSNAWLFIELFVVYILLWFVVDFQYTAICTAHAPKGYDTHRVYQVSIAVNPNLKGDYQEEEWKDSYLQIFRQVREYPGVESACYYGGTVPYEEGAMFQGYTVDSVHRYRANIRMVSKEFFDVFRVEILRGGTDNWDVADYPRPAVASRDLADSLFHGRPAVGQSFFDYYAPSRKYTLGGIAPRTKLTEYDRYEPFIYVPIEDWMMSRGAFMAPILSARVTGDAEDGFADRFTADMRNLAIGPFYFSQIQSYDEAKEIFDTKTNNYLRTSLALVLFFVFNVILGILGTFRFRTGKRRGEIGLRLALGASRRTIFGELLSEGLLILSIAVVPALAVCINIRLADLTVNVWMDPTLSRFLAGTGITLVLMLLMILTGIWYPAAQAMKIQPATALHEE
jgi:putative ABC transport system permease protein